MNANNKKNAVVICPGRGTYSREELGYLSQHHSARQRFINNMDNYRKAQGQPMVSELDRLARFSLSTHTRGDNASALIYTCALADFMSIDLKKFNIVAITGNSMGWYLALAASGACSLTNGMHITNTMGTLMHNKAEGGQLIFPLCDDNWLYDPGLKNVLDETLLRASQSHQVFHSINLGMMAVIAGDHAGIEYLLQALPKVGRYPLLLPNHAAFHTPLMLSISQQGQRLLSRDLLSAPKIPLVDGRGHIWHAHSSNIDHLYDYTFHEQVCRTYHYSTAIDVVCKEFAPDNLIILGPGTTLGAPTAHQLIAMQWRAIRDKQSFKSLQQQNPFILSMGMTTQRKIVTTDESSLS